MDCGFVRVRASAQMEPSATNSDVYRVPSSSSLVGISTHNSGNSRRYGFLSASSIIRAPISTLLEYSGLLGNRTSHQHADNQIRLDDAANNGEVSIRIIGAGEQELERDASGHVRQLGSPNEVSLQHSPVAASDGQNDSRSEHGRGSSGEGLSPRGANADSEAADVGNNRDAYQRYDIQQAARWIEQILPFSLLLLIVFIRQHLQGI